MSTSTSTETSDAFWGAMNREVGTIHAERNIGENGADQNSMYGMAGKGSQLSGAFVAAFAGLVRGCDRERVGQFVRNIEASTTPTNHKNSMATLIVLAFQTRDCRGGKGEKDLSRWLLLELYQRFPRTIDALVPLFPEYGYWRDLSLFIQDCSTPASKVAKGKKQRTQVDPKYQPLVSHLYRVWADQLLQDEQTMIDYRYSPPESGEKPKLSLAAKYVPKEGRSFDRKFGASKRLAELLFPEQFRKDFRGAMRLFRQLVSGLNETINTTERLMSAYPPKWDDIKFTLVPGCLLRRCRRAFLNLKGGSKCRENEARSIQHNRIKCADNLKAHIELGKQGKVTIKGKQNFLHQIVESHLIQASFSAIVDTTMDQSELDLLQLQWNDHRQKLMAKVEAEGLRVDKGCSLIDVSGSMAGTPMIVAVTLGILISEMAPLPFGDRFLTFEDKPTWVEFERDWPLSKKISHALKAPWGGTTDFMAAMDLMLSVAIKHSLQPEDLPEWFLVASDMQFNAANRAGSSYYPSIEGNVEASIMSSIRGSTSYKTPTWQTHHDIIVKAFHNAGIKACGRPYKLPRMVYWNLRGDTVGFPVQADTPNTQMLSGFSPDLLTLVLEQRTEDYEDKGPPTPWDTFVKAMDQERYDAVLQMVEKVGEGTFRDFTAPVRPSDSGDGDTSSTDSSMPDLEEFPTESCHPPPPPQEVGGGAGAGQSRSDWDCYQVADWMRESVTGNNDILSCVRREQVDGKTMDVIVSQADRESLVELGITSRLQQSRTFSQWSV